MRHRGISLKIIGVKRFMTWLPATRYLFLNSVRYLENVTWLSPEGEYQKWNGIAWVKDTEAEKLFRIREAEETKNSLM